ncbi:DUF3800 domain-containing protein [uncultured Slackia sp.]|uniref:DUF3800 domain-containing protein n=1 Tax=uncultured Slackia sp. TaxID=665903 RepID=UPI0025F51432|nr:DUF3800 domain-containing protein [uncultured Slackia sp.]
MRELSIFIDESGDFGPLESHAPFYLITLVLHDQAKNIEDNIIYLKQHIVERGFPAEHAIHSAPLVRREGDYESLDMVERKKLFRALHNFMRKSDILYHTFVFNKTDFSSHDEMVSQIAREMGHYVRTHINFFEQFGRVIIYYDNGQKEISTIINTLFNALFEVEVRKVSPSDYCLFQAADLICTLELAEAKLATIGLSKSEIEFFNGARTLKKNYLNPMHKKRL